MTSGRFRELTWLAIKKQAEMPLTNCIDCKKTISTSATICPHCGANPNRAKLDAFVKSEMKGCWVYVLLALVTVAVLGFLFLNAKG